MRLFLQHGCLNGCKDVGVRLLLPTRKLLPVGDIGLFRIREVLEDLADPAEAHHTPALLSAQFAGGPVCGQHELADLLIDSNGAALLPLCHLFPWYDVTGLWRAREVFGDA